MSYRIRWQLRDSTKLVSKTYSTREDAQNAIDERLKHLLVTYTIEEVPDAPPEPEPTSTTDRLVGLLRDRHAKGLTKYGTTLDRADLTPEQWAQHAIEEALDLAGYLMRFKDGFAPEPGSTAAHHVEILRERVKELEEELAKAKASLAASPQGTAKASEAPGEGGDSKPSSFDALEAFLRADTCRSIQAIEDGRFIVSIPGLLGNPASRTLEGIAARVEEMTKSNAEWLKPISRPKDKFGEGTNRWRLNALERFLDGDDAASLTWHEGEFHAVAEDVAITAPTLLALADKLAEKEDKP